MKFSSGNEGKVRQNIDIVNSVRNHVKLIENHFRMNCRSQNDEFTFYYHCNKTIFQYSLLNGTNTFIMRLVRVLIGKKRWQSWQKFTEL
jgi:hypothetical protein